MPPNCRLPKISSLLPTAITHFSRPLTLTPWARWLPINCTAVIEQVFADLKAGPLAHMPSGKFQANAAWLVTAAITHNLLRTAATLAGGRLARARAVSIRQKIINIPARIAHRARRFILHLPTHWKWAAPFTQLWKTTLTPPIPVTR